ncbi:hypothetical protein LJC33_03205 [Eubacteriales bacterium OttesenSCG-928-N13]|nr:hypothetical protein [Eubacteriales bacterium OttesenSCG-928-N13]
MSDAIAIPKNKKRKNFERNSFLTEDKLDWEVWRVRTLHIQTAADGTHVSEECTMCALHCGISGREV